MSRCILCGVSYATDYCLRCGPWVGLEKFDDIFADDKREPELSDPRYIEQELEEEWDE